VNEREEEGCADCLGIVFAVAEELEIDRLFGKRLIQRVAAKSRDGLNV